MAGIAKTLKSLMHARIMATGGDFAARTVFTDEDFAAALKEGVERRKCLDWARYVYKYYKDVGVRTKFLLMDELCEDEVRVCAIERPLSVFSQTAKAGQPTLRNFHIQKRCFCTNYIMELFYRWRIKMYSVFL
jgi:hypothetical protein